MCKCGRVFTFFPTVVTSLLLLLAPDECLMDDLHIYGSWGLQVSCGQCTYEGADVSLDEDVRLGESAGLR